MLIVYGSPAYHPDLDALLGPPADLFLFWSGDAFRLLQICRALIEDSDLKKISNIQYFDLVQDELN